MNAFDKIAKKSDSTSTKKTTVKIAAEVTDEVRNAVDIFISHKAELKRLEAEMAEKEELIISHVRPQQDKLAKTGSFTKSLTVAGESGSVLYSTSDRFSLPKDDASQTELKKVCGPLFDEMFEVTRTISVKTEALKDETILNKIAKACEKAGLSIADIFDVGDKLIAKDGLDEKQYKLGDKLEVFRTLARQNKPALK